MIEIILVVIVLSIFILVFLLVKLNKQADNDEYNMRQLNIVGRTIDKILHEAEVSDTPREDVVALMNAAADSYNESLRGKDVERLSMRHFPLVRTQEDLDEYIKAGRQTNPKRKKSQRKE